MDKNTKILIVEDDTVTAKYIEHLIVGFGYSILATVDTAHEAIVLARRFQPELILMDIHLKGAMDGIAAAKRILKTDSMPIVYLTALSDEQTFQEAHRSGPFGYVVKPFVDRELEVIIAAALYRENKERHLKDMEDRHVFTLRSLRGVSFQADLNFMPIFIHGPLEEMVGYEQDDFINGALNWDMITPPEDRPLFPEVIKKRLREVPNFQVHKEFRILNPKEGLRWLRHSIKNVCNSEGEPVTIMGSVCDITEYKKVYDSLNAMIFEYDGLKKATLEREIKMIALKKEINALMVDLGRVPKYDIQ